MSDVVLAKRYSPENYPIALNNLSKRFDQSDSESIHYTEAGFGDLSDDQANHTLRFFAEIALIENPKGANYIPSNEVITWQRKMGHTADEAKQKVIKTLKNYPVFKECLFILDDGPKPIGALAEEVGGLVGIDEDELTDMKRTIRVFAALGFLEIDPDKNVSISDAVDEGNEKEGGKSVLNQSQDRTEINDTDRTVDDSASGRLGDANPSTTPAANRPLSVKLDLSLDMAKVEAKELEEKLSIINKILGDDST